MEPRSGLSKIRQIKRMWILSSAFAALLQSLALAAVVVGLINFFLSIPVYGAVGIFVVGLTALVLYKRPWQISDAEVARLLNQWYPQLEESSQLLLREPQSLNFLENLQVAKIEAVFGELNAPSPIYKSLKVGVIAMASAVLLTFVLSKVPAASPVQAPAPNSSSVANAKALPQITAISVSIHPPAYTGKKTRKQDELPIVVEDGAKVVWMVSTDSPLNDLHVLMNNKERLSFTALNTNKTRWLLHKKITTSAFYQLEIDKKLSDLYKIEVIKDRQPEITIHSPQPHTVIDFGQPQQLPLKVSITDDYGITTAAIAATLASGKGESVSFKEVIIPFKNFLPNEKRQDLHQVLPLASLGMKPGDELYFSIKGRDNHNQEARSDIYLVTIADTAQLMSLEGLSSGVNLMPEYFRSQRQIIIDTEKLLRERDTLSADEFKNKSNNLGMDQKLLRLRYGKFLGEESESEVGEADHDHDETSRFGDPQSMIDAVSHKHDNSEDATFYEPEQKAQLKAVLTEMWKAELQLRTFKPQGALPFEYKALRLLKDLQQKSRAYVGKTAIKTPPLKPEKRLTGELSDIGTPGKRRVISTPADPLLAIRTALHLLEATGMTKKLSQTESQILQQASMTLTAAASRNPDIYLPAVRAMQRIRSKTATANDLSVVQTAFYKMLKVPPRLPAPPQQPGRETLSREYFKKLNSKRS